MGHRFLYGSIAQAALRRRYGGIAGILSVPADARRNDVDLPTDLRPQVYASRSAVRLGTGGATLRGAGRQNAGGARGVLPGYVPARRKVQPFRVLFPKDRPFAG